MKDKIIEILLAEVYNECFEDSELNTAVEEIASLITQAQEEAYNNGKEDGVREFVEDIAKEGITVYVEAPKFVKALREHAEEYLQKEQEKGK